MLDKYGSLFLAIGALWLTQFLFSMLQIKKFNKQYSILRRDGDVAAIGSAGSNWKRKVYAVLVVDKERNIVHARALSGFTVFASMKPVAILQGRPLSVVTDPADIPGLKKKTVQAFRNAAEFIQRHDRKIAEEKGETEDVDSDVQSVAI